MPPTTSRSSRAVPYSLLLVLTVLALGAAILARTSGASTSPPEQSVATGPTTTTTSNPPALTSTAATPGNSTSTPSTSTTSTSTTTTTTPRASTTTSAPASTTTVPTTAPLAAAGPGFVAGHVTAIGDSVMLDYQDPLQSDIPGITVDAAVSRQWYEGESILQSLKASGQLGAEVIVALGTNGPITATDFDDMMAVLNGASRVVFVNTHVDQGWQDPNNAVIAAGAARYPNVVVADWASLAAQNPQWFGPDGTHLAIDGPGADALASLITSTLNG